MEIEIYRAFIVVEERKERLTKAIAKQLPILDGKKRWDAAQAGEPQPRPMCKIVGKTLDQPYRWFYLVPDEEAGLGWVAATEMHPKMAETVIARGGWVDNPSEVPTVIL